MPDLDPQQLANDVLDQARMIRLVRDANQQLAGENAQLRDSWNRIELVKARYDDLKAEAETAEAKEIAAAMQKPVATTPEPFDRIAAAPSAGVQSVPSGPSRPAQPAQRKRGR